MLSQQVLSTAVISVVVGAVIGALAKYVPRFNEWFLALDETSRNLLQLIIAAVWSVLTIGASCINLPIPGIEVACTTDGFWAVVTALVMYLMGQGSSLANLPTLRSTTRAVNRRLALRAEAQAEANAAREAAKLQKISKP